MKIGKFGIMLLAILAGAGNLVRAEGLPEGYIQFKHPGLVVDGRQGRSVFDVGEFLNLELKEGEEPLTYVLGPLRVEPHAVVEYTAEIAVERATADTDCRISLLARDKNGKELARDLGLTAPDYSISAPQWQTVTSRAIVPDDTYYVELQLNMRTPFKLYGQKEGIRSLGKYAPAVDETINEKARISNGLLDVVFNPSKRRFGIVDNRTQKLWETFPLPESFGLEKVQSGKLRDGKPIIVISGTYLQYATSYRITLILETDTPKFIYRTETSSALPIPERIGVIESVPAIRIPDESHALVAAFGSEYIYPATRTDLEAQSYRMRDYPAWFGYIQGAEGPGMMCIVNSFQESLARLEYRQGEDGAGSPTVQVSWLPIEGIWKYSRDVEFWFSESGGSKSLENYFANRKF
ncbi:MAG: hypothetical protein AB3N63_10980 [Puniceicoccaceae bacterium]